VKLFSCVDKEIMVGTVAIVLELRFPLPSFAAIEEIRDRHGECSRWEWLHLDQFNYGFAGREQVEIELRMK
jgi:hypothetical protein